MADKRKDDELNETLYSAALAAGETQRPTYAGSFDQQLSDLYDRIANRESFKYNVNADPLYQQYKDQYIQGGKLAMKDTMGQAAALTGGYGSTYGQSVGQQAYDAYLQKLGDAIPELYSLAQKRYQDEGDRLLTEYGLVGDRRDTEYNRYLNELSSWEKDRDFQRQVENEEYDRRISDENTAYTRQQAAYTKLYNLILGYGYTPTAEELEAAGMNTAVYKLLLNQYKQEHPTGGGDGGGYYGGGGGGGGSGDYSRADIETAYYNAKAAGSSKEANELLKEAAKSGAISAEDKKYMFKAWQVR